MQVFLGSCLLTGPQRLHARVGLRMGLFLLCLSGRGVFAGEAAPTASRTSSTPARAPRPPRKSSPSWTPWPNSTFTPSPPPTTRSIQARPHLAAMACFMLVASEARNFDPRPRLDCASPRRASLRTLPPTLSKVLDGTALTCNRASFCAGWNGARPVL